MTATATRSSFAYGYGRDLGQQFDVLAAFAGLETRRKMALYDILMYGCVDGGSNFRKTVEFLWPQASHKDTMRLETFLRQRLNMD